MCVCVCVCVLSYFPRKKGFDIPCKLSPFGNNVQEMSQLIFGEKKNKKNISKCRMLKFLSTCLALTIYFELSVNVDSKVD